RPDCPNGWPRVWRGASDAAGAGARRGSGARRWRLCALAFATLALVASLQLHRVRVARGPRAENPPDHQTDQQDGRDEDEVARGHVGEVHRPRSSSLAVSVRSSASTRLTRRQTVTT